MESQTLFFESQDRKESMILDDSMLQGPMLLCDLAAKGIRIAAITAKDKLRLIFRYGLNDNDSILPFSSICQRLSIELARQVCRN